MKFIKRFLIGLTILLTISCKKDEVIIEKPIDYHSASITFKVDERMELLSVVQHFTTWAENRHTRLNLDYKSDVNQYFEAYANHQAVQLCQELIDNGFAYDAPPTFVLYHSVLPDFEQIIPYSDYLINRAGSTSNLERFANSLQDFAIASNFLDFYNSNYDFYIQMIDSVRFNIPDYDYVELLENYYGAYKQAYTIILSPLFHAGGYGPKIQTEHGELIYSIQGPESDSDGFPIYGGKEWFEYVTLHEFSHSFVNPITEKNYELISESENLYKPIESKMKQMAYNNWHTCVNEHLVRVNVARMSKILNNENTKNEILEKEHNQGFIYIYHLDSIMYKYENYRDIYFTYESFYNEIIKCFNSIDE